MKFFIITFHIRLCDNFALPQIGFVFSNWAIATKALRHKGAEILVSLRGPKGRGNLLGHKEKALILFEFGFELGLFSRCPSSLKSP